MQGLHTKQIVLGVCGSIAAYKALYLTRLLTADGASVWPVLTAGASRFVGPLSFAALAGRRPITDLWSAAADGEIGHVELAHRADAVVVAPASANTLARLASGQADDPLCAIALASRAPLCVAPAMETGMWEHAATAKHLQILQARGAHVVLPQVGPLASGRSGIGRMAEPEVIHEALCQVLTPQDLKDQHVLVTAGPTREAFDPVRFISNPSTGKMGYALARAAMRRGAQVELICGPTTASPPSSLATRITHITTAQEMLAACQAALPHCSVLLMTAAPVDFRPAHTETRKQKKQSAGTHMTATLVSTPDILLTLKPRAAGVVTVGFAAETDDVLKHGQDKLQRKDLDILMANPVHRADAGFGADTNAGWLLRRDQQPIELPLQSKDAIAHRILDEVIACLQQR